MEHVNLIYITDVYTTKGGKYKGNKYSLNAKKEFCKRKVSWNSATATPVSIPSSLYVKDNVIYTKPGLRMEFVTGFGKDYYFKSVEERDKAYNKIVEHVTSLVDIKEFWR